MEGKSREACVAILTSAAFFVTFIDSGQGLCAHSMQFFPLTSDQVVRISWLLFPTEESSADGGFSSRNR
jgi:hypothetical protein